MAGIVIVRDVMSKDVKVVRPDTLVKEVVATMNKFEIGSIVVIQGDRPVGIITERDILKKIVIDRKNPAKTTAQEVMSTPLVWIESNETVADALELMRENNVRRLAVIRNGRLVGMVTERRLTLSYEKR